MKMAVDRKSRIAEARSVLSDLGMPREQQNERSALTLLALLNLTLKKAWSDAEGPLLGITPIMDWMRAHYGKAYKPNTRETVRRRTIHHFVQAGIVIYNPDAPGRPVNSPLAVYQIEPHCLALLRAHDKPGYRKRLQRYLASRHTLAEQYARHREVEMVPITVRPGTVISLSPGAHSSLIRAISEDFGSRFVPGGQLLYIGDTGDKWGYFDRALLTSLGVTVDDHGKMPDVAIYFAAREWLILVEAVTSHGPVDPKRHLELSTLFQHSRAGLVFVSAFPDQRTFTRHVAAISWETEVWIAEHPSHLVHFNGARFLGPHDQ